MQKSKLVLWIGLGFGSLVLLLLAACGGFLFMGLRVASGDGEVARKVDELFREFAAGNFDKTYQSFTSPELRRVTSEAEFSKLGRLIQNRLGALRSKQVTSINIKQVNTIRMINVKYKAFFERGSGTVQVVFVKSLGDWQLNRLYVDSPEFTKDFSTVACPECAALHAEDATFCPKCGKKLNVPVKIE